jgi:hypothetical protein
MFAAYKKSMWPEGIYALPTSMFGCPEAEESGWASSFINLTLPDSSQRQEWNTKNPLQQNAIMEPNILGPYQHRAFQMNFCLKTHTHFEESDTNSTDWPGGQYCIYSFNNTCPQGQYILCTLFAVLNVMYCKYCSDIQFSMI